MYSAIKEFINYFLSKAIKTYTVDRCKEFSCYAYVENNLGIPVYFADPYSSCQRGSNENPKGII